MKLSYNFRHGFKLCRLSIYRKLTSAMFNFFVIYLPIFKSLELKRANLKDVQDKLAKLQETFDINTKKKEDLEKQANI